MVPASHKTQNREIDKLSNASDQLLSDRYKLTKKIKSLNKTLSDSNNQLSVLEYEVKNKLILKEQLDNNLKISDEIKILQEKIKNRNNANSELRLERDNLNEQLKSIQDELVVLNRREDGKKLLK